MSKEDLQRYEENLEEVLHFVSNITKEYVANLSKDELWLLIQLLSSANEINGMYGNVYRILKEQKVWDILRITR